MSSTFVATANERSADANASASHIQASPLLVAWFGAGNTREMSKQLIAPFMDAVNLSGGITDHLLLYLPHEYPECRDWEAYVARMVEQIDEQDRTRTRPLVLAGFSAGAASAYGCAHLLGSRCVQLLVFSMRPMFNVSAAAPAHAEEAFGVRSPEAFKGLSAEEQLAGIVGAWVPTLGPLTRLPADEWSQGLKSVVDQFQLLYTTPYYSGYAANALAAYGGSRGPRIAAPLLVVTGDGEEAKGERPEKMGGWRELASEVEIVTIPGATHMSLFEADKRTGKCEAIDLVVSRLSALAFRARHSVTPTVGTAR